MASLYDFPDIYEERFSEKAHQVYREHYRKLFARCGITDILDCSFGSGCLTFPLCDLGYRVYGSDLSAPMLERAAEKAREKGLDVPLKRCDFRDLTSCFDQIFSCVMSTGNALAHVDNQDVCKTLREMDRLIQPGGYLYLDSRNWDRELKNKERFKMSNPFIREDGVRINYVQVWDYHPDGSITIHILQAYEKDGNLFRQDVYDEHLTPFSKDLILTALNEMGYQDITVKPFPYFQDQNFEEIGWYCLLAKKPL